MSRFFNILRVVLGTTFLLAMSITARGQRSVHNYSINAGLSNAYVTAMTTDCDGMVWIATEEGLNRFDGNRFQHFTRSNSGLPSNELNALLIDPADKHLLWIATQRDGVAIFDSRTGMVDPIATDHLASPAVTAMTDAQDGAGGVFLVHYHHGVQYYNRSTGASRLYNHETIPGMQHNYWCMSPGEGNRLYVGHARGGLTVIDTLQHKIIEHYPHIIPPRSPQDTPDDVYVITPDGQGNLWIGTNRGAALMNTRTRTFTPFVHSESDPSSIGGGRVRDIKFMPLGTVWFATSRGGVSLLDSRVYSYNDISHARFLNLPVGSAVGQLASYDTRCIMRDDYGNIWIGNYMGGVDVIGHLPPLVSRVRYNAYGRDGSFKTVWSCVHDGDKTLWLGGANEIAAMRGQEVTPIPLPSRPGGSRTRVRTMAIDSTGRVWVGTDDNGVLIYNDANNSFTQIKEPNAPEDIRSLTPAPDGGMIAGTATGLYHFDSSARGEPMERHNSQLQDIIVQAVSLDHDGSMWVGTLGDGLYVFRPDGTLVAHHNTLKGFPHNAVNHIIHDSRGYTWVAGRGGLIVFDRPGDKNQYRLLSNDAFETAGQIKSVIEDCNHNILAATTQGVIVIRVSPDKDWNASFFGDNSGVPFNSFAEGAVSSSPDGRVYLGSSNGAFIIDPTTATTHKEIPNLRVTGMTVYTTDNMQQWREMPIVSDTRKVTLDYEHNTIDIFFNTPDFAMWERTHLSYRMAGLDDVWMEAGGANHAFFRNLRPGKYEFMVRRRLIDGNWSDPVTLLTIVVDAPWWLTWWAKAAYILLIAGALILGAWFYRHRLQLKQRLADEMKAHTDQQQLNEERLRFYTNITHELRTPLTLIMGPIEDMASDPSLPSQYLTKLRIIRDSSARLLQLINGILEFRRTETQNRRLLVTHGNLANLVREVFLRYKELNRNPQVEFIITIDHESTEVYYDSELFTTILNNLLSNAVKYTPRGRITVGYHLREEADGTRRVEITVADTGHGISPEALPRIFDRYYQAGGSHQASGSGIGLALVKSLVDLHKGTVTVQSTPGSGTTFTVTISPDETYPEASHTDTPVAPLPSSATTPGEEQEELTDSRLTIMVVEDNDDIREYITQVLSPTYRVLTAANGYEGLKVAHEQPVSLIISDIMMPELDGFEMCRAIKDDILTSHIPVILLSAKDALTDKTIGYECGADSYLTKPFTAGLLLSRVANIVRGRRLLAGRLMSTPDSPQPSQPDNDTAPEATEEAPLQLNPLDEQFINKIRDIIESNIDREDLGVAFIAERMCMSQSTLYRKVMAILGVSTNEYVRHVRLLRAIEMLREGRASVTEIAFSTGFGSHSSFGKAFKKAYGVTPTEFVKNN